DGTVGAACICRGVRERDEARYRRVERGEGFELAEVFGRVAGGARQLRERFTCGNERWRDLDGAREARVRTGGVAAVAEREPQRVMHRAIARGQPRGAAQRRNGPADLPREIALIAGLIGEAGRRGVAVGCLRVPVSGAAMVAAGGGDL